MKKSYALVVLWALLSSFTAISLPKLNSFPSASATIFLDFDGYNVNSSVWNGGTPFNCAASGMTDAQITEIFNRVSEDYRPFNITITTDSTVFLAAPLTQRTRVVVTPTSSWFTGVGGVSYTGSFTWGDDTPAFVFCDRLGYSPKLVGECCTHESGHTVGLSHQAKYSNSCTLVSAYNDGVGTGQTSWAPVMGSSYSRNMSGWNNGPTPSGCSADQDNLSIIVSQNGFTYRPDDHSDLTDNSATTLINNNNFFNASGIITTTADRDVFKLNLSQKSIIHLDAVPYSVGAGNDGADLDIKLTIVNSSNQVVGIFDPLDKLDATIDTTLNSGTYYIVVDGTGNQYTTDYGSLGSYTITGTLAPASVTPIKGVILSGNTSKSKHNLSWNILSDDPIKSIDLESSSDGRNFSKLTSVISSAKNFGYDPFSTADIFYRLKVTSVINQVAYSNIISLKSNGKGDTKFTISNLVHDVIVVNASSDYQYLIADVSGRVIATGSNKAGLNTININNTPNGIYVMQIISNNERLTERIIKQ